MKLLKKILAASFYLIFLLLFWAQIRVEMQSKALFSAGERSAAMMLLALLTIASAILYTGAVYGDRPKRNAVRLCVYSLFAVYLFNLAVLLFYDGGFRLTGYRNLLNFDRYLKENTNFIPFATIMWYYKAWKNHTIGMYYVNINLAGNLAAFAPFGFFLPALSGRFYKTLRFCLTVSLIIVFAEAMQFLFRVGSCDIDDFILNFAGAFIVFLIMRAKGVRKLCEKSCIAGREQTGKQKSRRKRG